jgi:NhaA family Na+:H+ antiporter
MSPHAIADVFTRAAPLGVVLGLLLGKTVGVFGGTWMAARFTRAELNPDLEWADLFAVAVLSGIGFTVSLLISELAFADDPVLAEEAKSAVLVGSLICRTYRRLCGEEEAETA